MWNRLLAHAAGWSRPGQAALLAGALLGMQGCASLPNAERARAMPHAQQVEFEGAQGPVSAARSEAILDRLEGKDGASSVLQKHLAYEQAVNADSPLVLGNKLTLLQNGPATYQAMFVKDLALSDAIKLEQWERRPLELRLKEFFARMWEYWL